MAVSKPQPAEIRDELQKYAWARLQEALYTKQVELPASDKIPAQTVVFSPSDYLKLAQWVANYKEGGVSRQNPPLNPDLFKIPKTV